MLKKPPLSIYQRAVEKGEFTISHAIIAAGILIESLISGLLGVLTLFYLPLGVGLIPAMTEEHGGGTELRCWAAIVTAWQATSHHLAACLGFSATFLWIRSDVSPLQWVAGSPVFTAIVVAASVITGLVAAWVETSGHLHRGYLQPRNRS